MGYGSEYGCARGCKNCPRRDACMRAGKLLEAPLAYMEAHTGALSIQPQAEEVFRQLPKGAELLLEHTAALGESEDEDKRRHPLEELGVGKTPTEEEDEQNPQETLVQFLEENSGRGRLDVQAFRGRQASPIAGAAVQVTRVINGVPNLFYEGITDISGLADGIILPAPQRSTSISANQQHASARYDILVTHPNFAPIQKKVDVYDNIVTFQPAQMRFRMEGEE